MKIVHMGTGSVVVANGLSADPETMEVRGVFVTFTSRGRQGDVGQDASDELRDLEQQQQRPEVMLTFANTESIRTVERVLAGALAQLQGLEALANPVTCQAQAMDFGHFNNPEPVDPCHETATTEVYGYKLCRGCAEALKALGQRATGALTDSPYSRFEGFLRSLLPPVMVASIEAEIMAGDPEHAAELVTKYLQADEEGRSDIRDLYKADVESMVEDAHERLGPPLPANVHARCLMCFREYTTSKDSLENGQSSCLHCGSSAATEVES